MPDHDDSRFAQRIDEANNVSDQIEDVVRLNRFRSVGLSVAALVGGNRSEPCLRERGNLMAPGIPGFGPSVAHHDQRAAALLNIVHPDAVGVVETMSKFSHGRSSNGSSASPRRERRSSYQQRYECLSFFTSAAISGTALKRSATNPKSATLKIGASSSLLIATMTLESFM